MTRHSKVFVPVSVDERLPDKWSGHFIYTEDNFEETKVAQSLDAAMFEPEKNEFDFSDEEGGEYRAQPTHWLEEKDNVYVLTEDELKELFLEFSKEMDTHYGFVIMPDRIYETRINGFLQSKISIAKINDSDNTDK